MSGPRDYKSIIIPENDEFMVDLLNNAREMFETSIREAQALLVRDLENTTDESRRRIIHAQFNKTKQELRELQTAELERLIDVEKQHRFVFQGGELESSAAVAQEQAALLARIQRQTNRASSNPNPADERRGQTMASRSDESQLDPFWRPPASMTRENSSGSSTPVGVRPSPLERQSSGGTARQSAPAMERQLSGGSSRQALRERQSNGTATRPTPPMMERQPSGGSPRPAVMERQSSGSATRLTPSVQAPTPPSHRSLARQSSFADWARESRAHRPIPEDHRNSTAQAQAPTPPSHRAPVSQSSFAESPVPPLAVPEFPSRTQTRNSGVDYGPLSSSPPSFSSGRSSPRASDAPQFWKPPSSETSSPFASPTPPLRAQPSQSQIRAQQVVNNTSSPPAASVRSVPIPSSADEYPNSSENHTLRGQPSRGQMRSQHNAFYSSSPPAVSTGAKEIPNTPEKQSLRRQPSYSQTRSHHSAPYPSPSVALTRQSTTMQMAGSSEPLSSPIPPYPRTAAPTLYATPSENMPRRTVHPSTRVNPSTFDPSDDSDPGESTDTASPTASFSPFADDSDSAASTAGTSNFSPPSHTKPAPFLSSPQPLRSTTTHPSISPSIPLDAGSKSNTTQRSATFADFTDNKPSSSSIKLTSVPGYPSTPEAYRTEQVRSVPRSTPKSDKVQSAISVDTPRTSFTPPRNTSSPIELPTAKPSDHPHSTSATTPNAHRPASENVRLPDSTTVPPRAPVRATTESPQTPSSAATAGLPANIPQRKDFAVPPSSTSERQTPADEEARRRKEQQQEEAEIRAQEILFRKLQGQSGAPSSQSFSSSPKVSTSPPTAGSFSSAGRSASGTTPRSTSSKSTLSSSSASPSSTSSTTPRAPSTPQPKPKAQSHPPPLSDAEWERRQAETARKQQEAFERQREQSARASLNSAAAGSGDKSGIARAWSAYEARWADMPSATALRFGSIPWPVLSAPKGPDDLTSSAIAALILSRAHSTTKPPKDRLKEALLKWHPDRFEGKWLVKVADADKELVRQSVKAVASGLNQLMALENSPFG